MNKIIEFILSFFKKFSTTNTDATSPADSTDNALISEVGFSYDQQLEQERAAFKKDTRTRDGNAEPFMEPELLSYEQQNDKGRGDNIEIVADADLDGNTPKRGDDIAPVDNTFVVPPVEIPTDTPPVVTPPTPPVTPPPPPVTPPVVPPTPPVKPTLNTSELVQENLVQGQYYRETTTKKQIYIHHTVSTGNPLSAINWWRQQNNGVSTFVVIAGRPESTNSKYKNGEIYQCFSSKYWAHHLGLKTSQLAPGGPSNLTINKQSIGIEICNWGPLQKNADGTYSAKGFGGKATVPTNQVIEYPNLYQGERYYQKYTPEQIESLRKLLVYLCDLYKIDKKYKGDSMFKVTQAALKGENGIFTHTSVRPDKLDCHPQPELIAMLKNL